MSTFIGIKRGKILQKELWSYDNRFKRWLENALSLCTAFTLQSLQKFNALPKNHIIIVLHQNLHAHFHLSYSFFFLFLPSYYLKRRKRHLHPTIVITEPPKLAQTFAYIPNSNCAVVKHRTVQNAPWTWSNNFLGTSIYCCQSLFRAFTSCWTGTDKPKTCQSETSVNQVLSNTDQVLSCCLLKFLFCTGWHLDVDFPLMHSFVTLAPMEPWIAGPILGLMFVSQQLASRIC